MAEEKNSSSAAAALELRPLSTGELMDRGFQLYRRHFVALFYFSAMAQAVPFAIGLTLSRLHKVEFNPANPPWGSMAAAAAVFALTVELLALAEGALTHYASRLYLGQAGAMRESFRILWSRGWAILYTTTLKYAILFVFSLLPLIPFVAILVLRAWNNFGLLLGLLLFTLLLIAPFLILAVRYLIVVPVIVLENRSGWKALQRSSEIVRYDPGQGFWSWGETRLSILLLVVLVANLLIVLVGYFPTLAASIGELLRGNISPHGIPVAPAVEMVSSLLNFLGSSLIAPLYVLAGTLFYYDVRVRKEAFDVELLAQSLPTPPENPPSAAPNP